MEEDVQGLVLASLSMWLQLIMTPTHRMGPNQPLAEGAGVQTPSPTCWPLSDLNSGTQNPKRGTTAW